MFASSHPLHHRGWEAGYSLAELLAVLAILAATSAVVMANFPQQSTDADTSTAATLIAAGLNATRTDAITRHRQQNVVFDTAHNSVHVPVLDVPIALPASLDLVLVVAAEAGATASKGTIAFYPDGSSTGGRVKVTGAAGRHDVVVDWLTGLVRIETLD